MTVAGENGKKKKVMDETAFYLDLQKAIAEVKGFMFRSMYATLTAFQNRVLGTEGEIFSVLKPPLAQLALLAIRLDEYNDNFFSLMPRLFSYNKFTMTVRLVFPHILPLNSPHAFRNS